MHTHLTTPSGVGLATPPQGLRRELTGQGRPESMGASAHRRTPPSLSLSLPLTRQGWHGCRVGGERSPPDAACRWRAPGERRAHEHGRAGANGVLPAGRPPVKPDPLAHDTTASLLLAPQSPRARRRVPPTCTVQMDMVQESLLPADLHVARREHLHSPAPPGVRGGGGVGAALLPQPSTRRLTRVPALSSSQARRPRLPARESARGAHHHCTSIAECVRVCLGVVG